MKLLSLLLFLSFIFSGLQTKGQIKFNKTFGGTCEVEGTFVQDAGDAVDSDFGSTTDYDQEFIYVATLTVENGIFTFSKNGQFVASGRAAAPRVNITKPVKNIQRRNIFN